MYRCRESYIESPHLTLVFPPTEAMKDIHMYPPYETFETKRP